MPQSPAKGTCPKAVTGSASYRDQWHTSDHGACDQRQHEHLEQAQHELAQETQQVHLLGRQVSHAQQHPAHYSNHNACSRETLLRLVMFVLMSCGCDIEQGTP